MPALPLLLLPLVSSLNVISLHETYHQHRSERLSQARCPSYHCAGTPLAENLCVEYVESQDEYLLQECKSTEACVASMDLQTNVTCIPSLPSTPPKYPGSPCKASSDCPALNTCTNSVCHGGIQGTNCTVESSCDVTFTCYRSIGEAYCVKQLDFGEPCSGYIDDTMCRNDAVCGLYTCVPWFSLENGQYTTSAYAAYACKSGYYRSISAKSEVVVCDEAPRSPSAQLPLECTPGSMCYSSDGKLELPCQCGFNEQGTSYCPLFPGDDLYQQYLVLLKEYSTGLAACAFIAIGESQCGASVQVWEALNQASVSVAFWGLSEGNDECVKAIFTGAFWNETSPDLHPAKVNQ